jgi:hypothetical protein
MSTTLTSSRMQLPRSYGRCTYCRVPLLSSLILPPSHFPRFTAIKRLSTTLGHKVKHSWLGRTAYGQQESFFTLTAAGEGVSSPQLGRWTATRLLPYVHRVTTGPPDLPGSEPTAYQKKIQVYRHNVVSEPHPRWRLPRCTVIQKLSSQPTGPYTPFRCRRPCSPAMSLGSRLLTS